MLPAYFLKIRRAYDQLEILQTEATTWLRANNYTTVRKADREHPGYYLLLASAQRVPLDPFSLLIGDILQSLRSGLDHVAYRLAENYTVPLPDAWAESSEFPIFGDKDRQGNSGAGSRLFRKIGRYKIRGVNPRAQAIIESLQPYHRGQGFVADPLWKLHELIRIDKHRVLHLAVANCDSPIIIKGPFPFLNWELGVGTAYIHIGPIETDTVIIRLPLKPVDPGLAMYVNLNVALGIAFPQGSIAAGEDICKTLAEIYNHIINNVLPPLSPYL